MKFKRDKTIDIVVTMWNIIFNAVWFVICMALLVAVTIMCVIVDFSVTVLEFFKKFFVKNNPPA